VHSQQWSDAHGGMRFLLLVPINLALYEKGSSFLLSSSSPYGSLLLWKANQGNLLHVFLPDSAAKSGK
jgi:hypothetical protein